MFDKKLIGNLWCWGQYRNVDTASFKCLDIIKQTTLTNIKINIIFLSQTSEKNHTKS